MLDREHLGWIQTASGGRFFPVDPRPEDIDIREIAHALSMICRFNGHCMNFYSVAQHSVLVSRLVESEYAVAGLLHDAAEAYLGDVTRPLKAELRAYRALEERVEWVIAGKFDIDWNDPQRVANVKTADDWALAIERRDIMAPSPHEWGDLPHHEDYPRIHPLPPLEARVAFEARCVELGVMTGKETRLWHCADCGARQHNDPCIARKEAIDTP